MTLSALAEQAGVAKSTVSLIERGQGNPSIDTIWALASALGVPFASLFYDEPREADVSVVRAADAVAVAIDTDGVEREGVTALHMLTRAGGAMIEIYSMTFDEGAVVSSSAHAANLFEHITIASGTVEVSSADAFCEVLQEGDLISFRADRAHRYRAVDGPVRVVSVYEYRDGGGVASV
jgi:transcriptional regulator with XRE-family HTH domain